MRRTLHAFGAVALASLLAGCATPSYYSPVEVTRFSSAAAETIPRGAVAVRAAPGEDTGLEHATFQRAVGEALAEIGFTPAAAGASEAAPYVALVSVERRLLAAGAQRGPVSVGGGASTGTYGSGVGLGVGLNLSPPAPDEIDTLLSVSIRPQAGGEAIWEGRARFTASANNEFANADAAASRMARALFQGFPGNSGETIEVR